MTHPWFSDRIFWLERRNTLAHCQYLTSGMWALQELALDGDPDAGWEVVEIRETYAQLFKGSGRRFLCCWWRNPGEHA